MLPVLPSLNLVCVPRGFTAIFVLTGTRFSDFVCGSIVSVCSGARLHGNNNNKRGSDDSLIPGLRIGNSQLPLHHSRCSEEGLGLA